MEPSGVRGLPSLDDDLHRLRPDGYQSAEMDGEAGEPGPLCADARRAPASTAARPGAASLGDPDGDAPNSRAMSAHSLAAVAQQSQAAPAARRRVQIQVGSDDEDDDDGDGDDEDARLGGPRKADRDDADAASSAPLSPGVRLPGQPLSFTAGQHGSGNGLSGAGASSQSAAAAAATRRMSVLVSPGASGAAGAFGVAGGGGPWASLSRGTAAPLVAMPPDDMPALHQAAWLDDLDTVLELLKGTSSAMGGGVESHLDGLVWYNKKLYPDTAAAEDGAGAGGAGRAAASGGGRLPPAPPQAASMATATSALKSLLSRDYLHHACHPLTIAAANGNERIVDELLRAMAGDSAARQLNRPMTWRAPPPELPPGCPWVTPLAAAALAGSGECVRLIAQAVARHKSLVEDRSTYGCFRFRALTVAQTADAVQSIFKYGCCHPDTIRYSLCDAARRLAKRDSSGTDPQLQLQRHRAQQQPQAQQKRKSAIGGGGAAAAEGVVEGTDGDGLVSAIPSADVNGAVASRDSPLDSPRATSRATSAASGLCELDGSVSSPMRRTHLNAGAGSGAGGGGGPRLLLQQSVTMSLRVSQSSIDAGGAAGFSGAFPKAAELLLFRARLFHDSLGRPLARALREFLPETLVAVAALAAMVEQGLHPDRFLSHAEHATVTSTSLLMVLVQNYHTALRSAAAGFVDGGGAFGAASVAAAAGSMRSGGSVTAGTSAATAATSMAFATPSGAAPAGDLSAAVRVGLQALAEGLLAHGAAVDDPPREGCRQVGGFHIAPPHGPEAPLHHAFIHGPQELVVLLLQYSSLHPETLDDLMGPTAAAAAAGGVVGMEVEARGAVARSFYSRRPGDLQPLQPQQQAAQQQQQAGQQQHPHHRHRHQHHPQQQQGLAAGGRPCARGSVPWEGDRSSPLLAFGAKMQRSLLEGNVPLWLHSGRFAELMEDLIRATIAVDARMVTCDLTWLVVELYERCMAHEFDQLGQLRWLDRESTSGEEKAPDGGGGAAGGGGTAQRGGPAAPPSGVSQDTVITVDPVVPASPILKPLDAKAAAAAAEPPLELTLATGQEGSGSWGVRRHGGAHPTRRASEATASPPRRKSVGSGGDVTASSGDDDDAGPLSLSSRSGSLRSGTSSSSVASSSSGSSTDLDAELVSPTPWRRAGSLQYALHGSPEDSVTLSIVHSLYRNTADAITSLHQALGDGSLEATLAAAPVAAGGGAGAAGALGVGGAAAAAALVDWTALLRLVARIAANTLNPPKSHGAAAVNISVFTTAKAVNQLLYAKDWARGADGEADGDGADGAGGSATTAGRAPSVVDIDLLRAIVRRHPHEAARLIHGMDLMRVELKGYRWDSIPMSLDQDFYAVLSTGEPVRLSSRPPTVAPASVAAAAAAAEEARRAAAAAAAGAARGARSRGRARSGRAARMLKAGVVAPAAAGADGPAAAAAAAAAAAEAAAAAAADAFSADLQLTREDILQACIFSNMWAVLTHFLLSATRLPPYMRSLQRLRNATYRYAVAGQMTQYGSIPVVLGVGLLLGALGVLARCLQRAFRIAGNLVLAGYGRLEERLQPAMNNVGRRLQLARVQRRVGRMVRRGVDQLAARGGGATGAAAGGGSATAGIGSLSLGGSRALMTVRMLPRYLSFLGVLLDPDALAEVWLGVTQHYSRGQGAKMRGLGSGGGRSNDGSRVEVEGVAGNGAGGGGAGAGGAGGGGDDGAGPAYMSWRTTRVVVSRVPLACAAAMPSALLYKLASSPQVNGELFASPVMRAVIVWRWQTFTRYFLLLQLVEHVIYMGFFMTYAFSLSYSPHMFSQLLGAARTSVVTKDGCVLAPSGLQQFLLITLGVMTLTCVVQEARQLMFFKLGWFRQPWNLMDFASSTIVGTIITLHLSCSTDAEWLRGLAAVEVALLFMRLLYFAMADDRLGSFFRMVIEVLRDCWLFFVFLGILFMGWGLALTVMQGQSGTIQETYLQLFTMIFGDFQLGLLQSADAGSNGLNTLWRMFASLYQILVTIILLNLLIAIINDSYERINDNEACESLRNKLTLIVEAESVLPSGMARRMLECLAKTDLYVITAEAATISASYEGGGGGAATGADGRHGAQGEGPTRRPLAPPSRWSGRMGETKRFVSVIADQLLANQAAFQSRLLSLLSARSAAATGGPDAGTGAGDGAGGAGGRLRAAGPSKRISGLAGGGRGPAGVMGLRSGGSASGPAAGQATMIDMADAEAFADVLALGRLLSNKLTELKHEHEETRRRQDEAAVALAELGGAVERIGRDAARSAAESAAAAVLAAADASRLSGEGAGPGLARLTAGGGGERRSTGSPGSVREGGALPGAGGGGGGGGGGAGGELVLIGRSELEAIALRAAEQAAQMAVQGVLRDLRKARADDA